jgi:hypothetical protein
VGAQFGNPGLHGEVIDFGQGCGTPLGQHVIVHDGTISGKGGRLNIPGSHPLSSVIAEQDTAGVGISVMSLNHL